MIGVPQNDPPPPAQKNDHQRVPDQIHTNFSATDKRETASCLTTISQQPASCGCPLEIAWPCGSHDAMRAVCRERSKVSPADVRSQRLKTDAQGLRRSVSGLGVLIDGMSLRGLAWSDSQALQCCHGFMGSESLAMPHPPEARAKASTPVWPAVQIL